MSENKNVCVGVGVWIFNPQHQILLGLRLSKHGYNTWAPPGGKQEQGEPYVITAIRETLEETGIPLGPSLLKYMCTTYDVFPDSCYHTVHYRANDVQMMPSVLEKDKCKEWRWFDLDKLPENLFLPVRNLLKQKNYCL